LGIPAAESVELRMWIARSQEDALRQHRRRLAGPTGCRLCGIESLAEGLARTRRALDPTDWGSATRGREIMNVHKTILIVTALVVAWLIVFKLHQ
jgi:formate dehydrogenase assembly factor FdhD